jgi:peptidoglycan/xylan/chitin deacetylase (PgdA/CDA1 family)
MNALPDLPSANMVTSLSLDLPVLMYHHLEQDGAVITPYAVHASLFASQLDILKKARFVALSFQELFAALDGKRTLPERAVVITFDDGYESFREFALPALLAHAMTATVFVVASEIGGINRWDLPEGFPQRPLMNEAALKEIVAAGMEIGSHGWAHRDLTACAESELAEEFVQSRQEIRRRLDVRADVFSYPYGRYSRRHLPLLAQAGYRGAVTIFSDEPTVTHSPYAMRRVLVHDGDTAWRFRLKLSPLYLRYVAWRDRKAGGPKP